MKRNVRAEGERYVLSVNGMFQNPVEAVYLRALLILLG
jgi:hypothetical protein